MTVRGHRLPLISAVAISRRYGEVMALADVSVSVFEGEFVAIIGPSGSGKSTLLKVLAGIEGLSGGTIEYSGLVSSGQGIVMVWQSLALFPHMTVTDNIAFGLRVRKDSEHTVRSRVEAVLVSMGLAGLGTRRITELSGGEQQRVAIARSLVVGPKVLLLDEPFGSLDAHLREQLQLEIWRVHRELGLTTVMVTHNQDDAMALASRIVVLNKGRVEQEGSPDEICESPKSTFVASFVGRKNLLEGVIDHSSQEDYIVATQLGMLRAGRRLGVNCQIGSKVVYVIDSGRLGRGSTADSVISGEVLSAQRLGVVEMVRVRVGSVILAWQRLAGSEPVVVEGSPITLSWSSADAFVLPSGSAS